MKLYIKNILTLGLILLSIQGVAKPVIADNIVGVVGKNHIMYSEVEEQYIQFVAQGTKPLPTRCEIFEELLSQKLLVNQADIDSIMVEEAEVESELSRRMDYFINQIGTEEKLVEYFGKSILEIKEDMRSTVYEQMLMQKMRMEVTSKVGITPSDVRNYYKKLPEDSIPFINAEVEVNQILIYPNTSDDATYEVRERLLGLRQRILDGEKFATLAVLYSEGPSSSRGGDLGWASKSDMDPAYSKAALALKKGQVSKIVETQFGYHIIQLVDREEDRFHSRHIILKPKIAFEEKEKAIEKLDSVVQLIRIDTLTFEEAAKKYSEDENTKENGGLVVNPYTGNTRFELDQFDTKEHYLIRDLKVGEISEVFESTDENHRLVYKVIRLKSRTEPHKANMRQDYELLKQMATQAQQNEIVDKWIEDKVKTTYVRIHETYKNCNFRIEGWQGE